MNKKIQLIFLFSNISNIRVCVIPDSKHQLLLGFQLNFSTSSIIYFSNWSCNQQNNYLCPCFFLLFTEEINISTTKIISVASHHDDDDGDYLSETTTENDRTRLEINKKKLLKNFKWKWNNDSEQIS